MPNSFVKDVNRGTTYTRDLFIGAKVCVEPATLLGYADDRRIEYKCVTNSPEQYFSGFEFSFFFS